MKQKLNLNTVLSLYTFLIIIPVLTLSIVLVAYVVNREQKVQVEAVQEDINSMIITAETNMNSITNLCQAVCYDLEIINFLSTEYEKSSYYTYQDKVYPRVKMIQTVANAGITDLTIYLKNETIPEGYGIFRHFSEVEAARYFERMVLTSNNNWLVYGDVNERKLYYVQGIFVPYGDEVLAVLAAEISWDWLLLQNQTYHGDIWILDDELLYSTTLDEFPQFSGEYQKNSRYVCASGQSSRLGIHIVLRVANETTYRLITVYIILFLTVLVLTVLIYFMVLRSGVHQLIEENVEKKIAQREAQIAAMQFQINPHMLCNTLQILQYQLELTKQYELSDSVAMLGKIMRYAIEDKSITTNIELELQHLCMYIEFQKLRFESGELEFELDVDESLHKAEMIKLTLQPMVENALTHGKIKGKPIKIMVRIYKVGENIRFEVINTGVKLSAKEIEYMHDLLYLPEAEKGKKSIGLQNINRRNILFYSQASALQITTDKDGNTMIAFEIPHKKQRKGVDDFASSVDFR